MTNYYTLAHDTDTLLVVFPSVYTTFSEKWRIVHATIAPTLTPNITRIIIDNVGAVGFNNSERFMQLASQNGNITPEMLEQLSFVQFERKHPIRITIAHFFQQAFADGIDLLTASAANEHQRKLLQKGVIL